jgi:serine protease Do
MESEMPHTYRAGFQVSLIFLFALVSQTGLPAADLAEIRLTGGRSLRGDILVEREEEVVLDLGFDVIQVPRASILEVTRAVEESSEGSGVLDETAQDLYLEAGLSEATIRELVERFGQSVVMVSTPGGLGSGFIINREGYVLTNFHVIEGEREITITLFVPTAHGFDREKREDVRIIAINPFVDLALLRIEEVEGLDVEPVYFGDSEDVRQGHEVFAIGNPLGLERSVSSGVVSATDRDFSGQVYIQTTAPINPGNSGGPLFNMRGEVIGVTNMKIIGFAEGLAFAIPIRAVKEFLRNREAFAFDETSPNTGYHYLSPPRRPRD